MKIRKLRNEKPMKRNWPGVQKIVGNLLQITIRGFCSDQDIDIPKFPTI